MASQLPLIMNTGVNWFPPQFAEQFYIVKGILGLIATLLLLYHMHKCWDHMCMNSTLAQRCRYLVLLSFSVLITGASIEQVRDHSVVEYRNIGSVVVSLALIITMTISIHQEACTYNRKKLHQKRGTISKGDPST